MPPKPRHVHVRPTHFLAFPISNPSCQAKSQEVIDVLLQAKPRPDGVDESLAGSPRSLHLTLGIMPLTTEKALQTVKASSSKSLVIRIFHITLISPVQARRKSH